MRKGFFAIQLTAGAIIVGLSIYGFSLLRQRPGLPPEIEDRLVDLLDDDAADPRSDRLAQTESIGHLLGPPRHLPGGRAS